MHKVVGVQIIIGVHIWRTLEAVLIQDIVIVQRLSVIYKDVFVQVQDSRSMTLKIGTPQSESRRGF